MCFVPQQRALFRHLNFKKCFEPGVLCAFWLRYLLRATAASTISTSQLPKVLRHWGVFCILTWKCASCHNSVHFFDISTSKSVSNLVCFVHFDFDICYAAQRRPLFRHLNFQKCSDTEVFSAFWLGNVLRATTACTFSTSQLQKVLRTWCALCILTSIFAIRATAASTISTSQLPKVLRHWGVFCILTWKCASCHNSVHFFDISTSKSASNLMCFVHFDFDICYAPQRRPLFRHLNFQKCSGTEVFSAFWPGNVLRATTACTFSTSQLQKVLRTWCALCILTSIFATRHSGVHYFDISTSKSAPTLRCFLHFDLEMCFVPQQRALFRHLSFKKCFEPGVLCAFWLRYLLRATAASTISTSQLPKVLRHWSVFCILTWKCASCHNSVHFFDISTSKSVSNLVCFVHFDFDICYAAQRRPLFRHLNFQKCSDTEVFSAFWPGNVLRATTACTFSTSQLQKVLRTWCALCILTSIFATRHNGVHYFDISTSKSAPTLRCFLHFDLDMCFVPKQRALFRHLNFKKCFEPGVLCAFWFRYLLRATAASTISTSQLPKVLRHWGVFCILTWTCASCHNSVHIFDISASKSASNLVCFVHFDFYICYAPQRRPLFRHLNFQKCSDTEVFSAFWLGNVLRATTACTFSTSQLQKVLRTWCALCILTSIFATRHNGVHYFDISTSKSAPTLRCFLHFDLEMCFVPQQRALFRHLNFKKCFEPGVLCAFWLWYMLRGTAASTISTSQLPKVLRHWGVFCILTWKCASCHNSVHFFDISTSKSASNLVCFVHFDFDICYAPQRRPLFRHPSQHLNFQKCSDTEVFSAFWLGHVLRATTACTFSTSQLQKVLRTWCALCILTSIFATRHSGVHYFDISTSKSAPTLRCFLHFDLEMCFVPQRRALFHFSFG